MKYVAALLSMVLVLWSRPVLAQTSTPVIDAAQNGYHLRATFQEPPVSASAAVLEIEVRDAATNQLRPVSAVRIDVRSLEVGRSQNYPAPPVDSTESGRYRSHKLYFTVDGPWALTVEIIDGAQRIPFSTNIEVAGVAGRIIAALVVVLPWFILALIGLRVALWFWRRRRRLQTAE